MITWIGWKLQQLNHDSCSVIDNLEMNSRIIATTAEVIGNTMSYCINSRTFAYSREVCDLGGS